MTLKEVVLFVLFVKTLGFEQNYILHTTFSNAFSWKKYFDSVIAEVYS